MSRAVGREEEPGEQFSGHKREGDWGEKDARGRGESAREGGGFKRERAGACQRKVGAQKEDVDVKEDS